jgi:exopolyphosphatase / guanosine-5'-triphosphate,3'-diphosphate pyrophosphatase
MPVLAAIDVGSNAIRLVVASIDAGRVQTFLEVVREPVRLGEDVFSAGALGEGSIETAVDVFQRFRTTLDKYGVRWTRAVATSAMREALNRDILLDRIQQASGIDVEVISSEEESRLIHLAVRTQISFKDQIALLVDIGGGSTEVTLASAEGVLSTESYTLGTVRLLRTMGDHRKDERRAHELMREYVDATQKRIRREIGGRHIDLCVGTGGNVEVLGELRKEIIGKDREGDLSAADLDRITRRLLTLTYAERVQQLQLRPDRADVIVPGALILRKILQVAGVDEVAIPRVGLKDGLLLDMVDEFYGERKSVRREQVIASALQVGRKFQFDEQHAVAVSHLGVLLFDSTRGLHNLGLEQRILLEVAALLHDIGMFLSASDHHKHTQYLLQTTPVVGLSPSQMAIVANVARYHRGSLPKPQHEAYQTLSSKERVIVSKLAAILRLADGMDHEHASRVRGFEVDFKKPKFVITLRGEGDLLLEKWALSKKSQMFEEVFNVRVTVEA